MQGQTRKLTPEELRKGATLYPNTGLPDEDPMLQVKKYEGLRTTDVLDGMQAVGLQDRGIMDKTIRPLWRDNTDKVAHRFYGSRSRISTCPPTSPRPTMCPTTSSRNGTVIGTAPTRRKPSAPIIRPGHAVVIDAQGIENTGFVGSNNTLNWFSRGMTGVVTNGNARDTDELILEKIPVYSKYQGGGTRPGRIEAGAINVPVVVGGALVRPGDMIVADGDGVVVVPREQIDEVAKIAWDIAKGDKAGRKKLYEKTKMPTDATIK